MEASSPPLYDDEAKAEQDAADKRLEFQENLDEARRDLDAETREEKLQLEKNMLAYCKRDTEAMVGILNRVCKDIKIKL